MNGQQSIDQPTNQPTTSYKLRQSYMIIVVVVVVLHCSFCRPYSLIEEGRGFEISFLAPRATRLLLFAPLSLPMSAHPCRIHLGICRPTDWIQRKCTFEDIASIPTNYNRICSIPLWMILVSWFHPGARVQRCLSFPIHCLIFNLNHTWD